MFSCEFCQIYKNIFVFKENLQAAASGYTLSCILLSPLLTLRVCATSCRWWLLIIVERNLCHVILSANNKQVSQTLFPENMNYLCWSNLQIQGKWNQWQWKLLVRKTDWNRKIISCKRTPERSQNFLSCWTNRFCCFAMFNSVNT